MLRRAILASVVVTLILDASTALAWPNYRPGPDGDDYDETQAFDCTDCHVGSSGGTSCTGNWPCFNAFGIAYRRFGWPAVAGQDTDGDNVANNSEVPGAADAGFHNSAASVGCDMSTCANNGSQTCSRNVRCTRTVRSTAIGGGCTSFCADDRCSGSTCTYGYYDFTFSCAPGTSGVTSGSGAWGCCSSGFRFNTGTLACDEINECLENSDDCVAIASCTNTTGSFTCDCPPGFAGAGRPPSGCTMCPAGTTTVGTSTLCTNIDECLAAPCGPGTCTELPLPFSAPGYTCACNPGYEFNGTTCVNINECMRGTDDCTPEPAATCTDSEGSFDCACNTPAFVGATGRDCVDYDECMDPTYSNRCSTAATCVNGFGTWACVCNPGFEGDGFTCVDIDECMRDTDECDVNATCGNEIGSYTCTCNANWEGSGVACNDIDECARGTGGCGLNENCINQVGAPNTCVCSPGTTRAAPDQPCLVRCGDGVRGTGEECDDANEADGDGCDDSCTVEEGWACRTPLPNGTSTCAETCGNGLVEPLEECDDGANNSDSRPDACRVRCVTAACGDDVVDRGEACDDGLENDDRERNACRTTCDRAYCGDGVIDEGELCDRGGGVPGAAVAGACTTACLGDAGVLPVDPPELTGGGCGCEVVAPSSAHGAWIFGLVGIAFVLRRRRR